ncbi:MAG TPA: hypothetical protein PLB35_03535 [Myxococcota bacterium]|nr:hypothetical protein [Myxococcota bacterium]HOA13170.1 hypothetical protein [Myxococcota bacterium]HOH76303.1 hypothetical protein [Myxococcota bacterium]HPV02954.1 hypothetical protein [Myxococcota bacterium]
MGLFGNKELQDVRRELDLALQRAEACQNEIGQMRARLASVDADLKNAARDASALQSEVAAAKAEALRLADCRERADKAAAFYEEKYETLKREIDMHAAAAQEARIAAGAASEESESLKARLAASMAENERLKARLARLEESGAAKAAPRPVEEVPDGGDARLLKAELETMRRRVAEAEEMRRVALRKAEHNRRAWLVTQMQLDLAEDRLCLLTTGKPRPVLESRLSVEVGEGEIIEAEDVEDEPGAAVVSEPTPTPSPSDHGDEPGDAGGSGLPG